MIDEKKAAQIILYANEGYSIHYIANAIGADDRTVKKYIEKNNIKVQAEGNENNGKQEEKSEIKQKEVETRTKLIGEKTGKAIADQYIRFYDENTDLVNKLIGLKFQIGADLEKQGKSFSNFILDAVKFYMDDKKDDIDFDRMFDRIFLLKALDRL